MVSGNHIIIRQLLIILEHAVELELNRFEAPLAVDNPVFHPELLAECQQLGEKPAWNKVMVSLFVEAVYLRRNVTKPLPATLTKLIFWISKDEAIRKLLLKHRWQGRSGYLDTL
jgi:hypothetical protein